jgi:hypothetical protein
MLGIQGGFVQILVFLPAIGRQCGRNSQMDMVQMDISQQGQLTERTRHRRSRAI